MFTSLHHLIDGEWMREAYLRTRKDGATGVDGVTADDYEKDLEANLESLLNRIEWGSYPTPPSGIDSAHRDVQALFQRYKRHKAGNECC